MNVQACMKIIRTMNKNEELISKFINDVLKDIPPLDKINVLVVTLFWISLWHAGEIVRLPLMLSFVLLFGSLTLKIKSK